MRITDVDLSRQRIVGTSGATNVKGAKAETVKSENSEGASKAEGVGKDQLRLSGQARLQSRLATALNERPFLRSELVESLQSDYSAGRYQTDNEQTARGIINAIAQRTV